MSKLVGNFPSTNAARTAQRAPRRASLQVECLEDRLALSTSSPAVHAVLDNTGQSVAYYIEKVSGNLNEKTDQGSIQSLGHVPTGTSFSAGLDRNGAAAVYASNGPNGSLEVFSDSDGRWLSLSQPVGFKEWAAVKGGRLYAIGTDGSLWQGQAPYMERFYIIGALGQRIPVTLTFGAKWTNLPGGSGFTSLDAVTDVANIDVLFGNRGAGNAVYEYLPGSGGSVLPIGIQSTNFSAGLDTNGFDDLFAVESVGNGAELVKWSPGSTSIVATNLPANSVISAANAGGCFFTTGITASGYNTIGKYDPSHGVTYLPPWAYSDVTQISAVSENDVFSLTASGSVQEFGNLTRGGGWFTWY
jgi:hypothetical protein